MHEKIKDQLSLDGMEAALKELAEGQGAKNAYCKLRFKYPMYQEALELERRFINSIRSGDPRKFKRGITKIKESKKNGNS